MVLIKNYVIGSGLQPVRIGPYGLNHSSWLPKWDVPNSELATQLEYWFSFDFWHLDDDDYEVDLCQNIWVIRFR